MTNQSEHLMELAEEIVKLRRENETLKRALYNSVSLEVVRGLKNDLYTALAKNDDKQLEIDRLVKQNEALCSRIDRLKDAFFN